MQYGQDNFKSRFFFFFMHACRDTTAIVRNGNAAVGIDDHFDKITIAGKRFVNRIIYYLINKMV